MRLKTILEFILGSIIALLFFESFFRLTEISLPSSVYDDPLFGRTHKPNAKMFEIKSEGFYMGGVNKYGYMGKAYPEKKDSNVVRIALIGDSFIEGAQVFEKYHFKTILEHKLNQRLNKKIEVLNFGIGGIDFRGMYVLYKKKALDFNPDIVLFFINNNDLIKKDILPVPEVTIDHDSLKITYEFLNSPESKIRRKFALIRKFAVGNLLKEAFEVYKTGNALEAVFEKLYTPPSNSSNQEDESSYDPFNSINNRIFHQLSYDNLHSHILNIIVPTNDLEAQYSDQNNDECLKRINLNAFLTRKSEEGKQLRYWKATNKTGHWNHEAHALIAEFLSNKLYKVIAK